MEFQLIPVTSELHYRLYFKEPFLELYERDRRLFLIRELLKTFAVGIDAFKYDTGGASSKAIEFFKFYGSIWFNVTIGVEKVEALLQPSPPDELIKQNFSAIHRIFGSESIFKQEIAMSGHFRVEGGVNSYLETLNPHCPASFSKFLKSKGITYTLDIQEHELELFITLARSIFVPDGLYASLLGVFSSNRYDFLEAHDVLSKYAEIVIKGTNAQIRKEP
ncbi:MAG: hypothetical protein AB1512_07995 [Thermodesulfobacteriota bacterium]